MKILTTMCFVTVLSCAVIPAAFSESSDSTRCCSEDVLYSNLTCSDGTNIKIECDSNLMILHDSPAYDERLFDVQESRLQVHINETSYTLEKSYYCLENSTVAVICEGKLRAVRMRHWFEILLIILNVISVISLAITTLAYSFLKEVQDTQSTCIFHMSLNACLVHVTLSYVFIFQSLFPGACITNLYFTIYLGMATYSWFTIMGHDSWIRAKVDIYTENDERLLKKYRIFGYGFPALIVVLGNIFAHAKTLYTGFELELNCRRHETSVLLFIVGLPILGFLVVNCFFFIDTQRRLWNSPTLKMRSKSSMLKMMKYRLILNGKVFVITGLLWSLMVILILISITGNSLTFLLVSIAAGAVAISAEGIFMFLVLVVSRKRILLGIARSPLLRGCNILPERWKKTTVDTETAMESDLDEMKDIELR